MNREINFKIDDELYLLKQTNLTGDLQDLLHQAHKAFFSNNLKQARQLIIKIKGECLKQGIRIHKDGFSCNRS